MTTDEKKLLQAKHRLEEAEMRDRNRERKARTRRLIQEGAILEKVFPSVASMSLDEVEDFLSLGSEGSQQRCGTLCGCRFRLSKLYQYSQ